MRRVRLWRARAEPVAAATTALTAAKLLGVSLHATTAELRAAFRREAVRLHPDLNPEDPTAKHRFQQLNDALGMCLTIAERRRAVERSVSSEARSSEPGRHTSGDGDAPAWSPAMMDYLHRQCDAVIVHALASAFRASVERAQESSAVADRSLERVALACSAQMVAASHVAAQMDSLPVALCSARSFDVLTDPRLENFETATVFAELASVVPRIVARLTKQLPAHLQEAGLPVDVPAPFFPTVLTGTLGITVGGEGSAAANDEEWNSAVGAPTPTCPELTCALVLPLPPPPSAPVGHGFQPLHRSRTHGEYHRRLLAAVTPPLLRWQQASARRFAAERRIAVALRRLSQRLRLTTRGAPARARCRR
jgi:hypothetical protein